MPFTAMSAEEAKNLITNLDAASTEITKKVGERGHPTHKQMEAYNKAASDLFEALTGREPTEAELEDLQA